MNLTNGEKIQIKQLLQNPQWSTAERLANLMCDGIRSESCLRDNEWDTIKATLLREGQVEGIKRFVKDLYVQAQNHE